MTLFLQLQTIPICESYIQQIISTLQICKIYITILSLILLTYSNLNQFKLIGFNDTLGYYSRALAQVHQESGLTQVLMQVLANGPRPEEAHL